MRIISLPYMTEFFRRPRSKKRRIVKKWKKLPYNWRPSTAVFRSPDGNIYCHPVMAQKIVEIQNELARKMEQKQGLPSGSLGVFSGAFVPGLYY